MARPSLKTNQSDITTIESLTIGAVAESIATSGGTIPTGTTEIHCYPAAAISHNPAAGTTPTATVGNLRAANEMFVIRQSALASLFFSTSGDQTMLVAYKGVGSNPTPG